MFRLGLCTSQVQLAVKNVNNIVGGIFQLGPGRLLCSRGEHVVGPKRKSFWTHPQTAVAFASTNTLEMITIGGMGWRCNM